MQKSVLVSVVSFDIHDNCTEVNVFVLHQIDLYKPVQLTNQIVGRHSTLLIEERALPLVFTTTARHCY